MAENDSGFHKWISGLKQVLSQHTMIVPKWIESMPCGCTRMPDDLQFEIKRKVSGNVLCLGCDQIVYCIPKADQESYQDKQVRALIKDHT